MHAQHARQYNVLIMLPMGIKTKVVKIEIYISRSPVFVFCYEVNTKRKDIFFRLVLLNRYVINVFLIT